jgi:hypothetical protein
MIDCRTPPRVAVAGCFVAAVGAQQPGTVAGDERVEPAAGGALVGAHMMGRPSPDPAPADQIRTLHGLPGRRAGQRGRVGHADEDHRESII